MMRALFENSRTALIFAGVVLVCAAMVAGTPEDDDEGGSNSPAPLPEASADMAPPPPPPSQPDSWSDWYGPEPAIGSGSQSEANEGVEDPASATVAPGGTAPEPSGTVYGPDGKPLPFNPLATPVPDPNDPD